MDLHKVHGVNAKEMLTAIYFIISLIAQLASQATDLSAVKKVEVERIPNNPPIKDDKYYGMKLGDVNSIKNLVQQNGEKARTIKTAEVKVKTWTESDARYYFSMAGFTYCEDSDIMDFNCKDRQQPQLDPKPDHHPYSHVASSLASVHTGFKNIADAMAPEYVDLFRNLLANDTFKEYKLVVTGHSLGGAVAQLAAIRIQNDLGLEWNKIRIVTYGQPRVGNLQFANWFNKQPVTMTRVVNEDDLVPHMPPIFTGYFHTHNEMYIRNNVSTVCSTKYLEDPNCSLFRIFNLTPDDHSITWGLSLDRMKCK
ncbi:hypothetical protein L0F63_001368 [Massospora cicadina]|nr:hypothetical protein L0F63_001368 [Massospora cicadina]